MSGSNVWILPARWWQCESRSLIDIINVERGEKKSEEPLNISNLDHILNEPTQRYL